MYRASGIDQVRRDILFNNNKDWLRFIKKPISHKQRVDRELRSVGVSRLGLVTSESHYLPRVIHSDEHIGGVVYGFNENGFVMLVATNWRVVYLDKKPLFINKDEINYGAVSGVKFSHAGLGSTVTLHTRVKDFIIQTFNQKCAKHFVDYIEELAFQNSNVNNYIYRQNCPVTA